MRTRICHQCCRPYAVGIFQRSATRRFCTETCRKRAERARARARAAGPNPNLQGDDE